MNGLISEGVPFDMTILQVHHDPSVLLSTRLAVTLFSIARSDDGSDDRPPEGAQSLRDRCAVLWVMDPY